jgi:hypothetical protein
LKKNDLRNAKMQLDPITPAPKSPSEKFQFADEQLAFAIVDFWQWNQSDLIENRNRGILAEYIVKQALGLHCSTRMEWDAYDFKTEDGLKIEVKSAAYIQAWKQTKYSHISFDIAAKRVLLHDNTYAATPQRSADIYIFCLLHEKDSSKINPMDLSQWTFYIVRTATLDAAYPKWKSIGLYYLQRITHEKCTFRELQVCFNEVRKAIL